MIIDGFTHQLPDMDPEETREWLEALDSVIESDGTRRAQILMARLIERARQRNIGVPASVSTPYINTIPAANEAPYPGDEKLERRIRHIIRWNAAVMVTKANKTADGIGGHLSSFASSALLHEVGFNHFFRGHTSDRPGDAVYFQGHASPGIYARAFLEGRIDESQLDNFRREVAGGGLSSCPHPRLMPDFWEYPTVSMGLGPINSIYQARFNKYLESRGHDDTTDTRVWGFLGDGETDEPESLGAITLAGREHLDNLTWVINCNLQRLDGPVRGNGKIIQELEAVFRGAGWNVLKVIWGTNWDDLIARDTTGALVHRMNTTVDGEYQRYKAENGAYVREHFFGPEPELAELVSHMTDEEVWALRRGGLDYRKVYTAYKAATELKGAPTVILAKTIKGWELGKGVQGGMSTHSFKKLSTEQLKGLRIKLGLEEDVPLESLSDDQDPPYIRPAPDSPEVRYNKERRAELGGSVPRRTTAVRKPLQMPADEVFEEFDAGSGDNAVSTTMAYIRLLRSLCRDENMGSRVVPIIPDEGRTFGMDALFKELAIYAPKGQLYEPVDHAMLLSYEERSDGQILEEGITEAGSMASWIAAATSYATRGVPMVPFFMFYSMFGFQRIGDLTWLAADMRARGFLIGATAGRTTLLGEGLQHQDGHSPLLASSIPTCEVYDPAFAYETAAIIKHGMHRMYVEDEDVYYYLTLYNENYLQPEKPEGIDDGIIEGMYRFSQAPEGTTSQATILFSGASQGAAREAQQDLASIYGVGTELWSVTSYKKLREQALGAERWNRLHPLQDKHVPLVTQQLLLASGPVVAVTDYMRAVPDQISRWVPGTYTSLGTDGFGRSDIRESLRSFFEVDTGHIVVTVLGELASQGTIDRELVQQAVGHYSVDTEAVAPWQADI
ncbi:MAG: pyruvate dehydrogenase (acetyl-transferring), homodimeric type [Acidobacteria bacterium]|nr:pyruvate dehydrogenase (acetyl-transferring), homodimeric type [Acidobacteriota bacterium]